MWHRVTLVVAVTLVAVLGPVHTGLAQGHGDTIDLAIVRDGGRLLVTATWNGDGHPVRERVAATLTASGSDGRLVGPLRLRPSGDRWGLYVVEGRLPPGTWHVVAEAGYPSLGRGQSTVTVPSSPRSSVHAEDGGGRSVRITLLAAAAAAGLAGLAGMVAVARRQRRPAHRS